jgi:hypothetical protein
MVHMAGASSKRHDASRDLPTAVENAKSQNDSAQAPCHWNGGVDPDWRLSGSQRTNRQSQAYNDKRQRGSLKQAASQRLSAIDHERCREAKYAIDRCLNCDGAQKISCLTAEP